MTQVCAPQQVQFAAIKASGEATDERVTLDFNWVGSKRTFLSRNESIRAGRK